MIRLHAAKWKPVGKSEEHWRSSLRTYAYPRFGNKRVDLITTADVMACLAPQWHEKTGHRSPDETADLCCYEVVPGGVAFAQPGRFADVPEDAFYSLPVASLAERGVFVGTGCDEGFCPGEAIDRKTMAVWTMRVLDGEDPEAVTHVVVVSFVFDRGAHPYCGVAPLPVMEDLQVLEDSVGEFYTGPPALPVQQFDLHASPERFHDGIDAPKVKYWVQGVGVVRCWVRWSVMTRW